MNYTFLINIVIRNVQNNKKLNGLKIAFRKNLIFAAYFCPGGGIGRHATLRG
jgi:hypothetical protein